MEEPATKKHLARFQGVNMFPLLMKSLLPIVHLWLLMQSLIFFKWFNAILLRVGLHLIAFQAPRRLKAWT